MYENLETNFPRELMEFADQKWPSTASLFPRNFLVQAYLHKYSDGIDIHYGREVSGLYGLGNYAICGGKRWKVIARNKNERRRWERDFDAVVVATGTFDKRFEPDYSGLDEWKTRYPNSVLHSKSYRNPRRFRGKKVLIIGNSASGRDISLQLVSVASQVWVSSTRPNGRSHASIGAVGPISRFDPDNHSIETEDGFRLRNIDKVILCTGYQYSIPFLKRRLRGKEPVWSDTFYIDSLFEHMFWIHGPSLSFVGLPKQGPTFLISQAQGAIIARYLAGRLPLPSMMEMALWEEWDEFEWEKRRRRPSDENAKTYHNLPYPKCKEYIDRLELWFNRKDKKNRRGGSRPFVWTDRIDWIMRNRARIRDAFEKQGLYKHSFATPESLGITRSKLE
ncbi:FAD/NAD(P)-binding domain-containing protein [Xylaria grammica]|nr:FAD/NAD(P)-binding domain-containing protein [Xylaria grammica]